MPNSFTLDDNTFASLPGTIRLNRLQWLRCYPRWPFIWFSTLSVAMLLACLHSWGWLCLVLPLLLMNWFYWVRVREHFACGDVCPAIVISTRPLLLAVGTDLTTGHHCHPVIKVIEIPYAALPSQYRQVGTRVPTVALYSGSVAQSSWDDFYPKPVGAASINNGVMFATLDRISDDLWRDFFHWKSQVPELCLGLHRIEVAGD